MSAITQSTLAQAEAAYRSGDLAGCRDHVERGLQERPDDLELLRLLAAASIELDDVGQASSALQRAIELHPDDTGARIDLAHVLFGHGDTDRAIALLSEAAASSDDREVVRDLVEVLLAAGRPTEALAALERLLERDPDDVPALLRAADLHLDLGEHDAAAARFRHVLQVDDEPGHEVHAYHGIIEAEALAGRWRRVLDHAIDATAVDRHQLTTDLLAYASVELFGASGEREPPSWEGLREQLSQERAQHRRWHDETRRMRGQG